jgi:UDP-glucose 4-epimerase
MTHLLIIGKHGYIASALCRWLHRHSIPYTAVSSADCDLEQTKTVAALLRNFESDPIQTVFTAAINPWRDNSRLAYEANHRMVSNFVRAAADADLCHLIYLSSVDVYGRSPSLPLTEATPPCPDSWYARAKYECEGMVRQCETSDMAATILRLPGIYGPGANDRSVVGKFVNDIRGRGEVVLQGGGRSRRDFVYVDDLCRIIAYFLDGRQSGTWNVATGVSTSIREIASLVALVLGGPLCISEGPANDERNFDLVFDNTCLLSTLSSLQFTPLRRGIQAYTMAAPQLEDRKNALFNVSST